MSGGLLRSITVDGRNLTDRPFPVDENLSPSFVLTFTDRFATVVGRVTDAAGRADAAAHVLTFPADRDA